MSKKRTESDFIGQMELSENALYGIHSLRAQQNFPATQEFKIDWFKAMGTIKKAVYLTYRQFLTEAGKEYELNQLYFSQIEKGKLDAMIEAASEIASGEHFEHFIVPALSGGAGTSINMNINELIANIALTKLGKKAGQYQDIDPINHANIFQSTNDVVPTSLKVATITLLNRLEESIVNTRSRLESLEAKYRNTLRTAFTQMQEAVPSTFGRLFAGYQEMISRDWWRVSKCFERIKVINLGGSAVGTGITVPQYMIFEMSEKLKELTKLPLSRGENMSDTTSNLDSFVEVHATLKSHAVNLEKMASDLRLLASDIGDKTISLPAKAVGSSIMPSKVNPIICEYVISASQKIQSNDNTISALAGKGQLDLNPYLPLIGDAILESLTLLEGCNQTISNNLLDGLTINEESSYEKLIHSQAISTALIPYIGYKKATEVSALMKSDNCDIFTACNKLKVIDENQLKKIITPSELTKLGYSLSDIYGTQ